MHGCQHYQEQMLDYLYDLLEEADQQSFLAHLPGCPGCQAACERAREQQKLLAAAARHPFPAVQFSAPPATPTQGVCGGGSPPTIAPPVPVAEPVQGNYASVAPAAPATRTVLLPVRPRLRRETSWVPWAVAAGLLVAVLGGIGPAYRARLDYLDAQRTVAERETTLSRARTEVAEAREKVRGAEAERDRQINEVRKAVKDRELRLVVSGPRAVPAGAPTDFEVRSYDLDGRPVRAELVAKVSSAAPMQGFTRVVPVAPGMPRPGPGMPPATAPAATLDLGVADQDEGVYRVSLPQTLRLQAGQVLDLSISARRKGGGDTFPVSVHGNVRLTAPAYLTHLTTDKPMYQPGEVVRFRSLTLDRATLTPATEAFRFHYSLTSPTGAFRSLLRGGNGLMRVEGNNPSLVNGPDGKPLQGVGAGEVTLEADAPGGEYTLTLSEEWGRFPPVQRKFIVNRYQKPRLDKKLDFNRSTYGPGDEVQARVSALRADGGPVKDRPVEITVNIDNQLYDSKGVPSGKTWAGRTDNEGAVVVRFTLPRQIQRGLASLAVKFDDGGAVETIVRPIPIVLKAVAVEFFPEGGDLIAGLPNRVYFQARTPAGKPAQLAGVLLEDDKPLPVAVATVHDDKEPGVNQGLGVFTFTPKAGRSYSLRIDSPAGISQRKPLSKALEDGVVLSIPQGVLEPAEPIRASVRSAKARNFLVGAYCRGRLLDTVRLGKGQTDAVFRLPASAGGVCRVTVFEEVPAGKNQVQLKPVAERLLYRKPAQRVDVSITADQRRYVPGQRVNLTLLATDEKEKPKPAVLLVAVVDRSVLTLADEKTYRTQPTQLLLASEVRKAEDLEYADFLLGTHPKAAPVLDMLLGTQGWRRFTELNPAEVQQRQRQQDENDLLVLAGQSSPRQFAAEQQKIDRLAKEYTGKAEQLHAKQAEASETLERVGEDRSYRAALATLGSYERWLTAARGLVMPLLSGLLVVVLGWLVLSGRQRPRLALAYAGVAAACGVLLAVLLSGPAGVSKHDASDSGGAEMAQLNVGPKLPPRAFDGDDDEERAPDAGDDKTAERSRGAGKGFAGGGPPPPGPAGEGAEKRAVRAMAKGGAMKPMAAAPRVAMMKKVAVAKGGMKALDGAAGLREDGKQVFRRAEGGRGPAAGPLPFAMKGEAAGKDKDLAPNGDLARREQFFNALRDQRQLQAKERMDKEEAKDRRRGWMPPTLPPMVVREYAHSHSAVTGPAVRSDFTETILWHPVLVLPDGSGRVSFDLSDSVTSFQVIAFAHTLDGRLGAARKLVESRLPFTLSQKLPAEVTAGDRIDVAVGIANNTPEKRRVTLALGEHDGLQLLQGAREQGFDLAGDTRLRRIYSFRPALVDGTAKLSVEGRTDPFGSDAIRETIRVVPDGFPVTVASSDLLEKSATHKVRLPATWLPGTLRCSVDVYPSTLADLQKGLEALLREPYGCFEQSSTTNYPNVLILNYLRAADKADPALERRVRELLGRGYQRLTSFECQDGRTSSRRGYEWFGGTAPPHEALTAYGLLQFRDMARVYDVDPAMLKRTQEYLMAQRDGKGGFLRNPRALDTFGRAPQHVTNAYIVWALTESGKDDVKVELNALAAQAKTSDDPYFLSLVALSLANRERWNEAEPLLRKVTEAQKDDGHLEAKQTSITGSGGRDLQIETTALALLGWLKTDALKFDRPIRQAVKWVGQQRGGYGGFGSTQSTILALKALIAHARANKRVPEAGELRLFVGDKKVADLAFPAGVDRPLHLDVPEPEKLLKGGENVLRVEITGAKNVFPHTLSWTARTLKPDSAAGCPVELTTTLAKGDLKEGDTTRLTVKLKNASGSPQGMAVAIVGLPAGLIVPEDLKQLKEHCKPPAEGKRPLLGAFEINGRELVLYWRDMAKDEQVEVPIDLVARVPGAYRGPASRAYLYYNADRKHWIEPLSATITAKP
jgi:hypothetical protein